MTVHAAANPRPLLRWCLRRRWRALAAAAALGLVGQAALIATPQAVQRGLDAGLVGGDAAALAAWAGVVVALGGLAVLFDRAGTRRNYLAGARTVVDVRHRLLDAVLHLDHAGASATGRGDLLSRNDRDANLLWQWIGGIVDTAILAITVPIILLAIARLDPVLAALGIATVPLLAALAMLLPSRYEAASRRLATAHGDRGDVIEALVGGSLAVRGLGGEGPLVDRHHRSSGAIERDTVAVARVGSWWGASAELIPAVGLTAGLAVGGLAAIDGRLSVGELIAFTAWMGMLATRVSLLVARQIARREARVGVGRIVEVLDRAPGTISGDTARLPDAGTLAAAEVTVEHHGQRCAGPVSFTVDVGGWLAITGPTGSGKSSLVRTLVGLDPVAGGRLRYGGVDLADVDLAHRRARIHLVAQRPVLVSGTVRDNLRLGASDAADEQLWDALHAAAVDDEVRAMPDGLDTTIGERGTRLSGGQVQRLALARGLLTGAAVLVLDDVTSAVDTATEATILDRLARSSHTVVAVSHRPAVLAAADQVVDLSHPDGQRPVDPTGTLRATDWPEP